MPDFSNITPYQTRKTLIERCKAGDPAAWLAFYTPYRNYARVIIGRKYGYLSPDECDELAHEVMVEVCRKIESFDPEMPSRRKPGEMATFRAWFYNRIEIFVRNYCRKRKRNREIFEFDPEIAAGDEASSADLAKFDARFHEEREEAIRAKALELLARTRTNKRNIEAFQMFLNGRSVADIAAELGMADYLVHQAVCRCRHFLADRRKELEELL